MLDEAGKDFHQAPLEGAFRFRDRVPRRHRVGARRELSVRRNPTKLFLALEDALAHGVPAVVELAFVLVGPLLEDVVRPMRRAGRPVHEKRLVRSIGAVVLHPGHGTLGQVFAQVILLAVLIGGRLDRIDVLVKPRLPLRSLAGHEAVEVVKAVAGGPAVERAHRGGLIGRRVVPFAEGGGLIAIVAQGFREGGGGFRDHAQIAVPVHGALGNGAVTDALMIAPGQKRSTSGRADRRGMKPVVADAGVRHTRKRGRADHAAVGVGQAESHIVEQHDEDIGRILGQAALVDAPLMLRLLQGDAGNAGRRRRCKRQHRAVRRFLR